MDSLLIQFQNNDTAHDDLHVWIEGYSRTTDSYYLALDSAMLPGDESPDKARRVLIRLLQRWIEALAQATGTRPVYLPFDFSDEYTGCFQCRPDAEFIEIVPGWSSREGWSFWPSDPGDYFLASPISRAMCQHRFDCRERSSCGGFGSPLPIRSHIYQQHMRVHIDERPNHAHLTRPSRPGCKRTPSWAGSLSLGR